MATFEAHTDARTAAPPTLLPPIVAVDTPSIAERFTKWFAWASRVSLAQGTPSVPQRAQGVPYAFFLDAMAATVGSDYALRHIAHPDPTMLFSWRTPRGEMREAWGSAGEHHAHVGAVAAELAAAVVVDLVEAGRSVDPTLEQQLAADTFALLFARHNPGARPGMRALLRVNTMLVERIETTDLTADQLDVIDSVRTALVELALLEVLHHEHTSGVALDAFSEWPHPVRHIGERAHLGDPHSRQLEMWLCHAMRNAATAARAGLDLLGTDPALADGRSPLDVHLDGISALTASSFGLERMVEAIDARLGLMRARFSVQDPQLRPTLRTAFEAIVSQADQQWVDLAVCTVAVDTKAPIGPRDIATWLLTAYESMDDLEDDVLSESMRRAQPSAPDAAIVTSLRTIGATQLRTGAAALLDAARVPAFRHHAIDDPSDREIADTLFAALAPMEPDAIVARLGTREGREIARAIVLCETIHADQLARGLVAAPELGHDDGLGPWHSR